MTKLLETYFSEVKLIEPELFNDKRGSFFESYNKNVFTSLVGDSVQFVQDNHSFNTSGVLRGLHYQLDKPQGKLIRLVSGSILDVVVDMRQTSPTFGKHVSLTIDSLSRRQLWVPPGFAHGFQVLTKSAEILYKMTNYWDPSDEHCLLWNDPYLNINWSKKFTPIVSEKDSLGEKFLDCAYFP